MAKEIPLTQGYVAIVDDEDYELVSKYKWCLSGGKYKRAVTSIKSNGKNILVYMHRLIMNPPEGYVVDHINGDGLDNRRNNLRIATHRQNIINSKARIGTSKFKGVFWDKSSNSWRARIRNSYKWIDLGHYDNEIEAAIAYDKRAYELWGEYARTNFPPEVFLSTEIKTVLEKRKTSKYVGVFYNNKRRKWQVAISQKYLGEYKSEEKAHIAYCIAKGILSANPQIDIKELRNIVRNKMKEGDYYSEVGP